MTENVHHPHEDEEPATGDIINTGDISNANVAIGRGANVVVERHYSLSGDFRGAILNIESRLRDSRQQIANLSRADDAARAELAGLMDDLRRVLVAVPPALLADAEQLAEYTQALAGAAAVEPPSRTIIGRLGQEARAIAARLGHALPRALTITEQIVSIVANVT